eukprot:TRINITY_DN19715_c0_g2_i1.p1 TRINITY_DN19715_c0_g2~~TRINITY_DN19715_c0_g2_i1.p1  ORF type:complete len:123 (+),score=32.73 TRINITY_DN19715_c0_g2_i1:98-466(+)
MRVLFCKFHCPPFICFCKSTFGLFSPGTLKLENAQHVSSNSSDGRMEVEKERLDDLNLDTNIKSSLKKKRIQSDSKEVEKGRVQWMDFLGKELVEIKEFEPSDPGDSEDEVDGNRSCVCVIQ